MTRASKLLAHPEALCNMVRRIAIEAGNLTLDYFEGFEDQAAQTKEDGSVVTAADHAILPEIPIISEEQAAAGTIPDITNHEYFWLVDPLDGTAAFLDGVAEYSINIALIKNGDPLIGVVYDPVKGELFAGCGPGTAIRWLDDTDQEKSIRTRALPAAGLTVITSRRNAHGAELEKFLENYKVEKRLSCSSALKFCRIATGKADLYPRFGETYEWDTAAGDAILRAAGASVNDLSGTPLRYGKKEAGFINPPFVACYADLLTIAAS
jgi:3'(2'), 5'-bisphosphate nucleotidase